MRPRPSFRPLGSLPQVVVMQTSDERHLDEALQIRQAGEGSVIAGFAKAVSKSMNVALHWDYWWHSTEEHPDQISNKQIMVELNKDFDYIRMTGREIQALVFAWQSMAISQDTMLHQFERGDVLPPGRSPQEEPNLIKANPPPALSPVAAAAQTLYIRLSGHV